MKTNRKLQAFAKAVIDVDGYSLVVLTGVPLIP